MLTSVIVDKFTILWTLLLLSFLYVAKDYPSWRKTRSLNPTSSLSTTQSPQKASEPHRLWLIPFLPFIILYLTVRGAFDLFRLGIFTLLQAIEWTGIALGNFILHVVTKSLPHAIEALGIWFHDHGLPVLRFLGQKLREQGMPALVRACEVAFDWTVALCMRVVAWAKLVGMRLKRFWAEVGKPLSDKFLAGAKIWLLDPLIWIVTRGSYLALVLYEAATRLAVAIWKDIVDLIQFIAGVAAKVWKSTLTPAGVYIASKAVQAWTLAIVQIPWMAWFALHRILIPAIKQSWILAGPTIQRLALTLHRHLISEAMQRFLISLGRRSAAAIMFWGQKSIRTAIFFVACIQSVSTKILVAWHWTHTHVVLPLSYLLPDTYRWFSSAIVRTYICLTSILFVFATRVITFLWPVLGPLVRLCNFIYTRLVRLVIISLYNFTTTHVLPVLQRFVTVTVRLAMICIALFMDRARLAHAVMQTRAKRAYTVMQAYVVTIAEIFGPVMAMIAEVAGQAYERVGPRIMKARAQLVEEADRVVEWIAANLMEWVKKETADESVGNGEKGKVE